MPLFFYKKIEHEYELAVWRMEEDESFFLSKLKMTEEDEVRLKQFQNPTRRLEWLASRWLLRYILHPEKPIQLNTDENRKPFLKNFPHHISISHCRQFAAVLVSEKVKTGIDVEHIHPRIKRIAHKFLNLPEEEMILPEFEEEMLTTIWSVKEAVFKLHGRGELAFAKEIHIQKCAWPCSEVEVKVTKPGFESNLTVYLKLDEREKLVVAWVVDSG